MVKGEEERATHVQSHPNPGDGHQKETLEVGKHNSESDDEAGFTQVKGLERMDKCEQGKITYQTRQSMKDSSRCVGQFTQL